jgi:hypothetical protein
MQARSFAGAVNARVLHVVREVDARSARTP